MLKRTAVIITAAIGLMTMTNCTNPGAKGIDKSNLDTSVSPKDDFYNYACGGWMAANPLPGEYSRFGTFDQLAELNREQLKELITGLDRSYGYNAQKIADLYALGMDSVTLNAQGATPLKADLAKINAVTKENLSELMATLPGVSAFFDTGVEADMYDASINNMYLSQGGLGMGDRDFYLSEDSAEIKVKDAYKKYIAQLASLAGYTDEEAQRMVGNVMDIETALAKASRSRQALRDMKAQYNPMYISAIEKDMPNVKLREYFNAAKVNGIDSLIVCQPEFLQEVNDIIGKSDIQAIRDYVASGYLQSASPYLSDDFIAANFEFDKVMSGVEVLQPRWKRAMSVPNRILSEALGELYVAKYFPESSKEKMKELVKNLQVSLGQHIDSLTWMSDETKAKAHEKLNAFTVKIGYPDKWRDYSDLTIDPNKSYWENIQAAILFNSDYYLKDYGKPVDRERWYMPPQMVNAYYNPSTNEICFPAAILQKPFFDPEADDALNYGAIGVVIGHEMTHGFDDQGRQYDKDGNMNDWWTEADSEAFTKLTGILVNQFNDIVVIDDVHANGNLTLGENIADQGGLRVAYTAYHNALNGSEGEVIDGLTPDQRFYLSYANVWAANIRPEEIRNRTKTDPHSLGRWRVNATLRNIEPFMQAFDITEGDTMYRPAEERVIIW